jgi:hypothetical protein
MTNIETGAEWASRKPQRSLIEYADRLQDQGHSIDGVGEAMMTLGLTISSKLHGPQAVAAWLLMLADKFAGDADRLELEARNAASN